MAISKPDLTRIWAETANPADVVDPDVADPGKFTAGWTAEVPPYEYFNFLQKLFSEGLAYINEQGIMEWDTDTTYPIGAIAKGSDDVLYRAIVEQNGNDPVSDGGTNWVQFAGGEPMKTTYLTSSDATWSPSPGVKKIKFIVTGAGGGGGGVDGSGGAGYRGASVAGAAGATAIRETTTIDSTYNITVGAGGTGGASGDNAGSGGGDSSVVSTNTNFTAEGGPGGNGNTATNSIGVTGENSPTTAATATGTYDIVFNGGMSTPSAYGVEFLSQSTPGASYWGGSDAKYNAIGDATPSASTTYGTGGVGANTTGGSVKGGDGADGFVVIEEYF